jgi:hypothetical protein
MATDTLAMTEAEILLTVLTGESGELEPKVARWLLTLRLTDKQRARMLDLADRNNAGTLTAAEREEMFRYAQVGNTLSILHAKARLALREATQNS